MESSGHLNIILLFGLVVLAGTVGSRLFQRLHIPQVIGYIIVGILLGDVLKLITPEILKELKPFIMFALGVIGFMIGSELRGEVFKRYRRQFFITLFSQGIGAFLLVAIGTSVVMWFVTGNLYLSIAMGLVLGAIASATAPAATADVLWEYKARGPLTAAILAIVALDDALALILYRGAATAADALIGAGRASALDITVTLTAEIIGTLLLGFIVGIVLHLILKLVKAEDKILAFSIGALLLVVGLSMLSDMDPILPSMILGVTIANLIPRQSKITFKLVERFSPPVYISFFVLAGAHLEFAKVVPWMMVMMLTYIIFRAAGKIFGSWLGAKYSNAPTVVRKYLGICLLPQAGIAIGLAILAGHQFNSSFGHAIIMVVMTATFIMEIIGPLLVKVGVKKAGEIGMNVTEEDLIKSYKVRDVMDSDPPTIAQNMPLGKILETFSKTDSIFYPVVDEKSRIIGKITITSIKEMFANQDVAGLLLAYDIADPVVDKTTPRTRLEDAMEYMRSYNVEYMPVVENEKSNRLAGMLDYRIVNRKISAEVLRRRNIADEMT
jgi:Kef-type K+ transport system membrane component KefB